MIASNRPLLRLQYGAILALLLGLAGCAWVLLSRQAAGMGMQGMGMQDMGLTMGMSALLFLSIWVVMMVAMMFPTALPMVLTFATISARKRERGQPFVPTWVFVGAYLLVWALAGLLAYALAVGADSLAARVPWLQDNAGRIGGITLILAGVYQLTPIKRICLMKCRTPMGFILSAWRDGYGGAFRMGVEHGLYCMGCCWLLFVILFPLGMMNIVALATVTALIFAEKVFPFGLLASRIAAVLLLAYGALVLIVPAALPAAM
ncbi:MAG TPA: DUF2182 domain-containing protein [Ktedonobacterales bacterium]|nr:DUF2182 domain-containing protein [Ktedonobacterales bacterium]